jgi:hypothetical protein
MAAAILATFSGSVINNDSSDKETPVLIYQSFAPHYLS